MSPTAGDETSRGRNPKNGRCQDFGRTWHRQSGFQHTDRPWPSSPELFNNDHNAGRESLSHLIYGKTMYSIKIVKFWQLITSKNSLSVSLKKYDHNEWACLLCPGVVGTPPVPRPTWSPCSQFSLLAWSDHLAHSDSAADVLHLKYTQLVLTTVFQFTNEPY